MFRFICSLIIGATLATTAEATVVDFTGTVTSLTEPDAWDASVTPGTSIVGQYSFDPSIDDNSGKYSQATTGEFSFTLSMGNYEFTETGTYTIFAEERGSGGSTVDVYEIAGGQGSTGFVGTDGADSRAGWIKVTLVGDNIFENGEYPISPPPLSTANRQQLILMNFPGSDFGMIRASLDSIAVPEPSSALLIALASGFASLGRRGRLTNRCS